MSNERPLKQDRPGLTVPGEQQAASSWQPAVDEDEDENWTACLELLATSADRTGPRLRVESECRRVVEVQTPSELPWAESSDVCATGSLDRKRQAQRKFRVREKVESHTEDMFDLRLEGCMLKPVTICVYTCTGAQHCCSKLATRYKATVEKV